MALLWLSHPTYRFAAGFALSDASSCSVGSGIIARLAWLLKPAAAAAAVRNTECATVKHPCHVTVSDNRWHMLTATVCMLQVDGVGSAAAAAGASGTPASEEADLLTLLQDVL